MYLKALVDPYMLTQQEIDELEKLVVKLHAEKLLDIYSLRSKWDPEGYARSQRKQRIPESTRWRVWYRDGMRCTYCFGKNLMLTLDHVLPEEQGGDFSEGNLVTACGKCNNKKANKPLKEFLDSEWLKKKRKQNTPHLSTMEVTESLKRLEQLLEAQSSVITGNDS